MSGGWRDLPSTTSLRDTLGVIPANADNAQDALRMARAACDARLSLDLDSVSGRGGTAGEITRSELVSIRGDM